MNYPLHVFENHWRPLPIDPVSVPTPEISNPRGYSLDYRQSLGPIYSDVRPLSERVESQSHAKGFAVVHVRKVQTANWYSSEGVRRKLKEITSKGLPDFFQWRFITFTIDRDLFPDPLTAFLHIMPRWRYIMKTCRDLGLWMDETPWGRKLEFHEDGWPHWHLLVGRTKKFTEDDFVKLSQCWGLGRVNVEMVSNSDFLYSFKYAFKSAALSDDLFQDSDVLPSWFLDHYQPSSNGRKPSSFSRVRFWQTSKGFYTNPVKPSRPVRPRVSSVLPRPLRQTVIEQDTRCQVVARDRRGRYVLSSFLPLNCSFSRISNLAAWHTLGGSGVHVGIQSYVLPAVVLKNNTNPINKWKLTKLLAKNRLSLKQTHSLLARGLDFKTC